MNMSQTHTQSTKSPAADRPVLALALGDAAGIGNELAAKVLADPSVREAARFIVIGDRRQFAHGCAQAGIETDVPDWSDAGGADLALLDMKNMDPETITVGQSSKESGRAALQNFAVALKICARDGANAACFTPFNKRSMRLAKPDFIDEIGFIKAMIDADTEGSEFNVLDELWNARVTSHLPLGEVARNITEDIVLDRIVLTDTTMRGAGKPRPRIAVAALNPHAGDGGNFGMEEINIITPAVEKAKQRQIDVTGPLPSDTVYMRANKGEFDAVLSMYHDQGQIAMKLIGFDRGVTLIGGYPFWIATPAHGTAYDIAGKGVANHQATANALTLAAKLSAQREAPPPSVEQTKTAIEAALAAKPSFL
ncbi:4-hydroxythreonine-4-phosphate dehydrogenase PdxA [Hwanghaeella sp.]|uniref:4-hydroxythreonine-4-phosphate dehydrogenase PdxA n=1 Tax=Hwanghaeella sp. TaxID=2605943 RepID=UPI003CCBF321